MTAEEASSLLSFRTLPQNMPPFLFLIAESLQLDNYDLDSDLDAKSPISFEDRATLYELKSLDANLCLTDQQIFAPLEEACTQTSDSRTLGPYLTLSR
jgi:hypothetical protein